MELFNYAIALITVGLGLFSLIWPRRAMAALDLTVGATTMGVSEVRASIGGLWLFISLAALIFNTPQGYQMLALGYVGAGLGRIISIIRDNPPMKKAGLYFAVEVVFAAMLLLINT